MRPYKRMTPEERARAIRRYFIGLRNRPSKICSDFGISRSTLIDAVRRHLDERTA